MWGVYELSVMIKFKHLTYVSLCVRNLQKTRVSGDGNHHFQDIVIDLDALVIVPFEI